MADTSFKTIIIFEFVHYKRQVKGWRVGVRLQAEAKIFYTPQCLYRLCGPPSLLSNGYRGPFPGGKVTGT
jgi:hypothetical protein